jgi:hypothetical protein
LEVVSNQQIGPLFFENIGIERKSETSFNKNENVSKALDE